MISPVASDSMDLGNLQSTSLKILKDVMSCLCTEME